MRSAPPIVPGMPLKNAKPGDAGLLRRARHHDVEHRGAGGDAMVRFDLDLVEAAPEPDHHARHAAVAHDQVGADADHGDRESRPAKLRRK